MLRPVQVAAFGYGPASEDRDARKLAALWPRTTIATSAIKKFRGDAVMRASRTPAILADTAHAIFLKDAKTFTGNFLIDDTFLFSNGVRDFDRYRVDPGVDLEPDFFVPDDSAPPVSLAKAL